MPLAKLRKPGDRRERRFELVRHVRGKLAPQRLALLALGRVERDDDRAGDLVFRKDGRCDHIVIPLVHFERQLRAAAGESALGGADDLLRAAAAVEVVRLAVRRRGQKIARRYIAGENVQPLIEQEEALPMFSVIAAKSRRVCPSVSSCWRMRRFCARMRASSGTSSSYGASVPGVSGRSSG